MSLWRRMRAGRDHLWRRVMRLRLVLRLRRRLVVVGRRRRGARHVQSAAAAQGVLGRRGRVEVVVLHARVGGVRVAEESGGRGGRGGGVVGRISVAH